ncbi:MAG: DUF222 domain-containing protein [Woeseiaceae bacterium]|nr:DUF222 domain-containing protein [Woeseiaceae bacterium]
MKSVPATIDACASDRSSQRPATAVTDTAALAAQITDLCSVIHAATYRLLVMIRDFDDADGWHQPGLVSCAQWLNFQCGIGMNAAREKVRVAHALRELPKISKSFERGEVSYSKVRAMTRIANADNEDYLLNVARHGTAHHVEELVRKYRRVVRLQDAEQAETAHRERCLEYYHDADGCLVINARLPAEQGALIVKALEHAMESADAEADCDDAGDSPKTVAAADDQASAHPAEEARTATPIAARRADALAEVAETYLQHSKLHGNSADRYQVIVHVRDQGTVSDDSENGRQTQEDLGDAAYLEDGPGVTAETSRRLACDCSVVRVVENDDGEPLNIGRKSRSIPPAIRRALKLRDGGCRFPGCNHKRFVDGHHIEHWANGGETSLDNLVLLCRHHYRLVHEGGYGCERRADGEIVFTAPDETVLPEFVRLPPLEKAAYERFEREMRATDLGTCIPEWRAGETIDWDLAVAALFDYPRESPAPHLPAG